ncbi:methyl-accepting chemotaxis protein [Halomonas sp. GXIMD04776]|uniref:methyl-accepting chemotaxis protein n=1 Tax=Halomonas sp. GXIMD04776 TaxID=3415605 RepID=UPI003CA0D23D
MHFKSIRTFIAALVGACLLLVVAALVIYAIFTASQTQDTVETRTQTLLKEAIDERLTALGQAQAGQIQRRLDIPMTVASMLAKTNELMGEIGPNGTPQLWMNRDELSNLIAETLREHPQLDALYIGWEPNAFDVDQFFTGREMDGYFANGRFAPWWYRTEEGNIEVDMLDDINSDEIIALGVRENEYYECPKQTLSPCIIDPVPLEFDDDAFESATSFNVPVIVEGEFRGVAGADLGTGFIQQSLIKANEALYDGAGSMALIAPRGGLVGYTPDDKRLGTLASDVFEAETIEHLAELKNNQPMTHWDAEAGQVELYLPFEIANSGVYWTLLVQLPDAVVMADLQAFKGDLRSQSTNSIIGMLLVGLLVAVVGLVAIWFVGSSIARTLRRLADRMRDIASGGGDLTQRLPVKGRNETAELATQFNAFADKINDVLLDVRESSESVRVAASEIAMGGEDLSSRTETAASNIQETSASMEQLTSTFEHTAQSSRQANQLSESASEVATRGGQVVANVVQTMDDIDASSKQIAEIVTVMDSIAFQTNLLALNASVEAARAGEQGRGFAVVASEVRQLAGRSADAAQQIKELIDNSSNKTRAGAELVRNAGATMDEIVASVARVTDVLGEISAATNEQSQGIGQVNEAVAELDRMTQENAAMVEESTTAAGHLQEQSQRLAQIVGAFTLAARHDGKAPLALPSKAKKTADYQESERA